MGILSLINDARRDYTAGKIGLGGRNLDLQIQAKADELGIQEDDQSGFMKAISRVEMDWLLDKDAERNKLVAHTIVETFARKREEGTAHIQGYMPEDERKSLARVLREAYKRHPLAESGSLIVQLQTLDEVMLVIIECANDLVDVRELVRLAYPAKVQIINGKY